MMNYRGFEIAAYGENIKIIDPNGYMFGDCFKDYHSAQKAVDRLIKPKTPPNHVFSESELDELADKITNKILDKLNIGEHEWH